jgi:hypothetical protein
MEALWQSPWGIAVKSIALPAVLIPLVAVGGVIGIVLIKRREKWYRKICSDAQAELGPLPDSEFLSRPFPTLELLRRKYPTGNSASTNAYLRDPVLESPDDFTRCPHCANAMEDEDVVCLHCGYNTVTRTQARTRKVRHISGFDVFLWLLPGIACALAVITLLAVDIVYCIFINEWVDQEAWYSFVGSLGMKIWLVVPTLYIMYLATRFAIKRLILDNRPPEVEEK